MVGDAGVPVEAGPRVHAELPAGSVQDVADAVSLQQPQVSGCVPEREELHWRGSMFYSAEQKDLELL